MPSYETFTSKTNASTRRRPRTEANLEEWAASRGTLHAGSTVNETLFFYKWLFFGDLSRSEIKAKMEKTGLLDPQNNTNEDKRIEEFFSTEEKEQTLETIEEALKEQDDDSKYFPIVGRLIAALRNWVLYGKEYLHWNELMSEYHCRQGKDECFVLAKSKDFVPEGEEYMIASLKPYMKQSTQLQLRPRVLSDASIEELNVKNVSKKVKTAKAPKKKTGPLEIPVHLMRGGRSRRSRRSRRGRKTTRNRFSNAMNRYFGP